MEKRSGHVFICHIALLLCNQPRYTNEYESTFHQTVLGQVHRFFQTKFLRQCDLVLLLETLVILYSP